jgi:hypothetical protein
LKVVYTRVKVVDILEKVVDTLENVMDTQLKALFQPPFLKSAVFTKNDQRSLTAVSTADTVESTEATLAMNN